MQNNMKYCRIIPNATGGNPKHYNSHMLNSGVGQHPFHVFHFQHIHCRNKYGKKSSCAHHQLCPVQKWCVGNNYIKTKIPTKLMSTKIDGKQYQPGRGALSLASAVNMGTSPSLAVNPVKMNKSHPQPNRI